MKYGDVKRGSFIRYLNIPMVKINKVSYFLHNPFEFGYSFMNEENEVEVIEDPVFIFEGEGAPRYGYLLSEKIDSPKLLQTDFGIIDITTFKVVKEVKEYFYWSIKIW